MYKIIGTDGREYGPATADQLRQWLAEGRANAQTPTLAPGAPEWKPLGALPEFAGHFAPPIPPVIGPLKPGTSTAGQLPKTNSFATEGLIFGILSLTCCCGCPFNILGLVFSLIGLSQINRHPELYEGRGLAIAGLILSAASLVLGFGLACLNLHSTRRTSGGISSLFEPEPCALNHNPRRRNSPRRSRSYFSRWSCWWWRPWVRARFCFSSIRRSTVFIPFVCFIR